MTQLNTKPIYFMHVKKCAGTSLVGLARRQKGLVRLPKDNANAIPAHPKEMGLTGDKRWINFWLWPLEEQKVFIEQLDSNFFANEGYIDENFERLDGYFYLVCLRSGVDRFISHYRHLYRLDRVSGDLSEIVDKPETRKGLFNYASYQLSGRRGIGLDLEALEIAKSNLMKFDHIVFSETYDEDTAWLRSEFGWTNPPKIEKHNSSDASDGVLEQLGPDMRAAISDLNATDEALFKWAFARRAEAAKK